MTFEEIKREASETDIPETANRLGYAVQVAYLRADNNTESNQNPYKNSVLAEAFEAGQQEASDDE